MSELLIVITEGHRVMEQQVVSFVIAVANKETHTEAPGRGWINGLISCQTCFAENL